MELSDEILEFLRSCGFEPASDIRAIQNRNEYLNSSMSNRNENIRGAFYNKYLLNEKTFKLIFYDSSFQFDFDDTIELNKLHDTDHNLWVIVMSIDRYMNYSYNNRFGITLSYDLDDINTIKHIIDMYLYHVSVLFNLSCNMFNNGSALSYALFKSVFKVESTIDFWHQFYDEMEKSIDEFNGRSFMKYFVDMNFTHFPEIIKPPEKLMNLKMLVE